MLSLCMSLCAEYLPEQAVLAELQSAGCAHHVVASQLRHCPARGHLPCGRPQQAAWQARLAAAPLLLGCLCSFSPLTAPLPCSRTIRRIYWALLGALGTWWLLIFLKNLDVDNFEGLWIIVIAVRQVACMHACMSKIWGSAHALALAGADCLMGGGHSAEAPPPAAFHNNPGQLGAR